MVTFIQKKNKGLTYAKYSPKLDLVILYWEGIKTVRKFKNVVFILNISFPYTQELLIRNKISFRTITEL